MARVLVTGASGYIGSHLAQTLSRKGHQVTASSRQVSTHQREALADCELVEIDVLSDLSGIQGSWDAIAHTATANDVISRDFRAGVELSTLGTQNVLELARRTHTPHLIFFSTMQVYGCDLEGEITPSSPVDLFNPYGLNHFMGELTAQLFGRQHGLNATIVRPANVYGCPVSRSVNRWTLVPMCFVREALQTGCITLRSSGLQRRDFVSLRQVSDACAQLISDPPKPSSIVNIASGETWNILDAAQWVQEVGARVTGVTPEIRILSQDPKSANSFTVINPYPKSTPGGGTPEEMRTEIEKMFAYFSA
jgi:UDP-glucose 4-epimerase